jgi:predicted Zn-dependent protease
MGGFPALLHDPATGATRRVLIGWRAAWGGALTIDDGGAQREVPAAALALAAGGWRGDAIHLTWEDDGRAAAVTIDDPGALVALGPELATRFGEELARVRRRRARQRRGLALLVALGALAVLLPLGAAVAAVVFRDAILDAITRRLPVAVDLRLGEWAYQEVAASGRLAAQGPALDAVRLVGRRLVDALPETGGVPAAAFRFRFEVLRDGTVNAFAAPGGLVVVHAGLLAEAESADEVAGVLAHEVAHVAARHSLRQLLFQLGLVASLRLLLGDDAGQAVGSVLTQLGSLRFSRDQERDADRRGVELLARARLPAAGLESFFDRLAGRGGAAPALLSSHPPSAERAAALARLIGERGRWPTEPLELDWDAVRRDARRAERRPASVAGTVR